MEMRPYWLMFDNLPQFSGLGLGAGITAHSEQEACEIAAANFGNDIEVKSVSTINTADEIEQNHVRPNMGNLLIRGVWFPKGFETL
jgi:hypothetical protein